LASAEGDVQKTRVLVVDDSVVMRRIISEAIACDSVEVVGTAANGRIALQKIDLVRPDVVTLDIEMPEMDGLDVLKRLRETHPSLRVIVFSSLTESAAEVTLKALAAGAADYDTKPSNAYGAGDAVRAVRESLLPKLLALGSRSKRRPPASAPALKTSEPVQARPSASTFKPADPVIGTQVRVSGSPRIHHTIDVVAIGASTGGPNALADVFRDLPKLGVPIVVSQHMPPMFTRMLAERLNSSSACEVREAVDGDILAPGLALIAPGDFHMLLRRDGVHVVVSLGRGLPENSVRPSVDPMLRSAVEVYGAGILTVILTGMGQDGLRGCEVVHGAGGQIVAQDEASSVVWGMPGFVVRAGLADSVVPVGQIAFEIDRRVLRCRASDAGAPNAPWPPT
jgi:two-component system chemotaxis response regulator CheB